MILAVYSNHGETRKCSFHFITSTSAIDFGRFFQSFRLAKGRRIRDSGSSEEDVPPHEEKVLKLDYCKTVLISDLIIKILIYA